MKKILIVLSILAAAALFVYYRKRKKESEGESENPVYNLDPVQKTRKGSIYKALTSDQVAKMAKEVMVKFPSNLVLPDAKLDLINRLLKLQRQSLINVYWYHYNGYGKSRGYDMIWLLDNFTYLKNNKRAKALRRALSVLIPQRPEITKGQATESGKLFWGLPMILNPFN